MKWYDDFLRNVFILKTTFSNVTFISKIDKMIS